MALASFLCTFATQGSHGGWALSRLFKPRPVVATDRIHGGRESLGSFELPGATGLRDSDAPTPKLNATPMVFVVKASYREHEAGRVADGSRHDSTTRRKSVGYDSHMTRGVATSFANCPGLGKDWNQHAWSTTSLPVRRDHRVKSCCCYDGRLPGARSSTVVDL